MAIRVDTPNAAVGPTMTVPRISEKRRYGWQIVDFAVSYAFKYYFATHSASDLCMSRLQDWVNRKQVDKPEFKPLAATDFPIRIKTGRRPPAVFRLNVPFDAFG